MKYTKELYNCWRSFRYNTKGKNIGNSIEWNNFQIFYKDVVKSYEEGKRLIRKNKNEQFSKENFIWVDAKNMNTEKESILSYNNETKTLKEWCLLYNLNYNGVRQRFFRGRKTLTAENILFGTTKIEKKALLSVEELTQQKVRSKASKMISAYKNSDKRKNLLFNIPSIDWFVNNILLKECVYCSSSKNVGADRKDNNKGHEIDNIVPCCYNCNTTRNNIFSFEEMLKIGTFLKLEIYSKRG